MLRAEDNRFLTESGAGTGMGELLRRFWLPVLLSEELPEADGPPKKLLAGFRGIDHDHGVHGINIGPDGKLYAAIGEGHVSAQSVVQKLVAQFGGSEGAVDARPISAACCTAMARTVGSSSRRPAEMPRRTRTRRTRRHRSHRIICRPPRTARSRPTPSAPRGG